MSLVCPTCQRYLGTLPECPDHPTSSEPPRAESPTRWWDEDEQVPRISVGVGPPNPVVDPAVTRSQPPPAGARRSSGLTVRGTVLDVQTAEVGSARGAKPFAVLVLAVPVVLAFATGDVTVEGLVDQLVLLLLPVLIPVVVVLVLVAVLTRGRGGGVLLLVSLAGRGRRSEARRPASGLVVTVDTDPVRQVVLASSAHVQPGDGLSAWGPRSRGLHHAWFFARSERGPVLRPCRGAAFAALAPLAGIVGAFAVLLG